MLHKTLRRILGCALLSYGGAAFAFTLITVQPPSNTVTDTFTLQAQVQPIAGTIRSQIFGLRRPGSSRQVTQIGGMMLAANDRSGTSSDVNTLAAAANDPSGSGSSGGGNAQALWISSTIDSLENTFFRTAFHGATQNVLVGYDITQSDKYVLGVSGGYEASNFVTQFNSGNEKTGGYNLNPYAAWLISDAWTLDLIAGYGKFNTDQSRAIGGAVPPATVAVDSSFSSNRSFASTNITNISGWGNWKLTSSLGYLWSQRNQDAYTESAGGIPVAESKLTSKQWNLLEEIAYGRGNSETYFGARFEDVRGYQQIQFTTGEQPANDPTSVLLTAGWRYFGKGLTASFVFSGRVAQEQVKEHGFSMVLRMDI
ncbi:MAG TPA: autotransporter outer membrane beta-barrel domain-containing protein [Burkholderiales bacterium]|nr:autotransporter outer membrane beta-barrel domain-containing protein [Burkholderiales bacterium]